MIILLPLLRKLSIRSRTIVGALVAAAGVIGLVAAALGAAGIVVDALIALVVGGIFLGSAAHSRRRGRAVEGRAVAR